MNVNVNSPDGARSTEHGARRTKDNQFSKGLIWPPVNTLPEENPGRAVGDQQVERHAELLQVQHAHTVAGGDHPGDHREALQDLPEQVQYLVI